MTRIDVCTYAGAHPFGDTDLSRPALLAAMEHAGVTEAWVSWMPSLWWRDPSAGNPVIGTWCDHPWLRPVPAVHPGLPHWHDHVAMAAAAGAPCIRADPGHYAIAPNGPEMRTLVAACAAHRLPLLLATRIEDLRQRHPLDAASDLQPWAVRDLIRSSADARLIVSHADREFVEQVHFGATDAEAERILWDIAGIWGPPEDHLELLLETVGIERFTFGSGAPFRLADTPAVRIEMLGLDAQRQALLDHGNLRRFNAW